MRNWSPLPRPVREGFTENEPLKEEEVLIVWCGIMGPGHFRKRESCLQGASQPLDHGRSPVTLLK